MTAKRPRGFLPTAEIRFQAWSFIGFFRKGGKSLSSIFSEWAESKDFHAGDRLRILETARGLRTSGDIPTREGRRA